MLRSGRKCWERSLPFVQNFPIHKDFQEYSTHVAVMGQGVLTPICLNPTSASMWCLQPCFCLTSSALRIIHSILLHFMSPGKSLFILPELVEIKNGVNNTPILQVK